MRRGNGALQFGDELDVGCRADDVRDAVRRVEHESTVVGGGHLCWHVHAPRVDEQLPQFFDVDGVEPDADPPVPQVRGGGMRNLSGSEPTSASRSSLGKPKPMVVSSRENAA